MMMGLTPERRKELRELARQHNEKQAAVSYTHLDVYKRQAPKNENQQQQQDKPQKKTGKGMKV